MGKKDYDLGDGAFTMPATESIDESLSRLARQDARRVSDGGLGLTGLDGSQTAFEALRNRAPSVDRLRRTPPPPPASALPPGWGSGTPSSAQSNGRGFMDGVTVRTSGSPAGKQTGLKIVRWVIVLGVTWFLWRFFLR
jgi:hypothetical protein